MRLDVCVLADVRVGDVAAPCHAAALGALAAAGYRVGVLPIATHEIAADPHRTDPDFARQFDEGALTRIGPGTEIECTLALAFDSRMFFARLPEVARINAAHRIVTVERPYGLANASRAELDRVALSAELALGGPPVWAPNSIICRDALHSAVPNWEMTDQDWRLVAPDLAPTQTYAAEKARPVVGMCRIAKLRRGSWQDLGTDTAQQFESPVVSWQLRASPEVSRPEWPQRSPVQVWSDEALSLPEFLSRIDILANPDVAEDDPCPVEALLALRAGVIPYLSPEYRSTFGGAALYGSATVLPRIAIDFQGDSGLADDLRATGQFAVENPFSADAFVGKIRDLVGAPRKNGFAPAVHAQPQTCALFYSSNGVGMGHLTRQLAIARRLPAHVVPVFVSHSQAVDLVREFGYACEYIPYHAAYGQARAHWNAALAETLCAAFGFYRPSAVVYDGNIPFIGLMTALERAPSIARIWVRRGMWGLDRDTEALNRGNAFDLIVEPGEIAAALDDGPTASRRAEVLGVAPVRILDTGELPDRITACETLGLDPAAVNVLVAPGSGNNFDTGGIARLALSRLTGRHGIGVAMAEWKIARETSEVPAGVATLSDYPFARSHNAFDFAIAAAGYNTFAEHIANALPTIWTPNEHAEQDRQILRARFALDAGLGCQVRVSEPYNLAAALDTMLDANSRDAMRRRGLAFADRVMAENGALEAAQAIAELCHTSISRAA